jgi:hypothetical protein
LFDWRGHLLRPSRCQYCGGIVRSPHALGGLLAYCGSKRKLFVLLRNNQSRQRRRE